MSLHRGVSFLEFASVEDLSDEGAPIDKDREGDLHRHHEELVAPRHIARAVPHGRGCHVAQDDLKGALAEAIAWRDLADVHDLDGRVGGQGGRMRLKIKPNDLSLAAHALCCIERPRAGACAQIQHALPAPKEPKLLVDLLELKNRAGGIAIALRPSGEVVFEPPPTLFSAMYSRSGHRLVYRVRPQLAAAAFCAFFTAPRTVMMPSRGPGTLPSTRITFSSGRIFTRRRFWTVTRTLPI